MIGPLLYSRIIETAHVISIFDLLVLNICGLEQI